MKESLFDKHRENNEFARALVKACTKRTSCCHIYEYDEQKYYEYRFFLKSLIVEEDSWIYEIECQDLSENKFVYLKVKAFTQLSYYFDAKFTSTIIDVLSPISGAWIRLTDEIKHSIGNNAFFTAHTTFRLTRNKPYGFYIPFINESKELEYRDDSYNKVIFHLINDQLKEKDQSLIPLHTSIFED